MQKALKHTKHLPHALKCTKLIIHYNTVQMIRLCLSSTHASTNSLFYFSKRLLKLGIWNTAVTIKVKQTLMTHNCRTHLFTLNIDTELHYTCTG